MGERFERVAILGLGLMGASLGMALRAGSLTGTVAGYDAVARVAERARGRGAVDAAYATVGEAIAGAELVVLAAPVLALRELLAALAPHVAPNAVVTDVGSTKAQVVTWAEEMLPAPECFVGGHPMAGREQSGVEAADPSLYRACVWCLTPTRRTAEAALRRVEGLVTALDARPFILGPSQHDAAVTSISHLPLVAAAALTLTAAADRAWPDARILAAGGFRDTTRVASGDPRMARDICLTNTEPLVAGLDVYIARLQALRDRIAARDATLEAEFSGAQRAREAWLNA